MNRLAAASIMKRIERSVSGLIGLVMDTVFLPASAHFSRHLIQQIMSFLHLTQPQIPVHVGQCRRRLSCPGQADPCNAAPLDLKESVRRRRTPEQRRRACTTFLVAKGCFHCRQIPLTRCLLLLESKCGPGPIAARDFIYQRIDQCHSFIDGSLDGSLRPIWPSSGPKVVPVRTPTSSIRFKRPPMDEPGEAHSADSCCAPRLRLLFFGATQIPQVGLDHVQRACRLTRVDRHPPESSYRSHRAKRRPGHSPGCRSQSHEHAPDSSRRPGAGNFHAEGIVAQKNVADSGDQNPWLAC